MPLNGLPQVRKLRGTLAEDASDTDPVTAGDWLVLESTELGGAGMLQGCGVAQ